jgi:hypothetical protein
MSEPGHGAAQHLGDQPTRNDPLGVLIISGTTSPQRAHPDWQSTAGAKFENGVRVEREELVA